MRPPRRPPSALALAAFFAFVAGATRAPAEDAATALDASAPKIAAFKAETPESAQRMLAALSAEQLVELGRGQHFFDLYTMPKLRDELGSTPDDDRSFVDMVFEPFSAFGGQGEVKATVDFPSWQAYWKRSDEIFVGPEALAALERKQFKLVSYGDESFFRDSSRHLSMAGSLLDPKRYGDAASEIAQALERYPDGFFKKPAKIEVYATGRMMTGECGTAGGEYDWQPEYRIALFCRGDLAKVLHHEIGHLIIPVAMAEQLDGEIYGGLVDGRNRIKKARADTPEAQASFLPNCIQEWNASDPEGAWNAAEDFATIVDNLQCGRAAQVLELARANAFVRKKVEKVSQMFAARGFDVSAWRP